MTMPAGKYYIGDLCYVLHDAWDEFCEITIEDNRCLEGEFTLKDGRRFATYHTAHGDGTYEDELGRCYPVDAGLIGCILLSDIKDETYDDLTTLGAIIEFDKDFTTGSEDGILKFGNVFIDTDPRWDYDDEGEEF